MFLAHHCCQGKSHAAEIIVEMRKFTLVASFLFFFLRLLCNLPKAEPL
jgi:hypothetical protein